MEATLVQPVLVEKIPAKRTRKVPAFLIKETIDGIPFYYRGYRKVLNRTKTLEEIMGCSGLQSFVVGYFLYEVFIHLNRSKFRILSNEVGNHLSHKTNLSYDIAIFEKKRLTPDKITRKYIDIAPLIVVEVDVRVELEGTDIQSVEEFVLLKTQNVFEFGVQKLVWVLTRSKKVVVAENGRPWQIFDWNQDLQMMEGIPFNVGRYLEEEGINVDVR